MTSLAATTAVAQHPAPRALIREKVDENVLTTLRGNTPPPAIAKNDAGPVNGNMPMTDLILVLQRSPEMQAAFDAFVESQYEPNSPNFHHWLTPEQIGEQFGPATSDIAKVTEWLGSHGLTVNEVSKDRMTIRFGGTARQVEATFHTQLHNLNVSGKSHFANMSDPQIPMALEPVVLGPKALHNFFPRPLHRTGGTAVLNQQTGHWERQAATVSTKPAADNVRALPQFGLTGGSGSNTYPVEDVAPYDFATIYNVLPVWNNSIDGTGQTIAIVGTSDVKQSDVSSFKSTFGLPAGLPLMTKLAHGNDPGNCKSTQTPSSTNNWCTLDDQIENALDVEWSGAIAPGAQIILVVSGATSSSDDTVFDSAQYAVQNNTAKILNVSYGLCELGLGTSGNTSYNNLWQSAASAGMSVVVASGDAGSPACDQGGDASGTPYEARFGLAVSGIASTPYNVAVGGTDLNWDTVSHYWNTTNSSTNGSSAKGYMPEIPWNNSCTNTTVLLPILQNYATKLRQQGFSSAASPTDAESSCNFIANWNSTIVSLGGSNFSSLIDTIGGGGGKSNCTTNDNSTVASCSGGYAKPSWQTGVTGIPSDGKRDIPDVSFFAGNGFEGSAYLICVSDWGACISRSTTTEPSAQEIGGTSAGSPAMAGVMALINQKAGSSQGNPNPTLYQLATQQTYASCSSESGTTSNGCYFNDVDTGTISMPCDPTRSPNCTVAHSGDTIAVLSGFDAGVGFDNATGLGTLNVANVVNHFSGTVTGTGTATVAVAANPTSITSLQGTTVTVTVSGASGTPTGSIILTSGSYTSSTQSLDNTGTATFNIAAGALPAGTDTVTAHYAGDSNYAPNTGTVTVTVTLVNFTLSAAAPAAISAGANATSNITVSSTNGYVGNVTLTCALTSAPANAVEVPTCAATPGQATVAISGTTTSGTGQVTVGSTAAPAPAVKLASNRTGWFKAAGGAALASLVLFFLPGWSKRNRNLFCTMLVVLAASFFAAGCGGGGGSSSGGGGGGTTKTTPTVTVTPAQTSIAESASDAIAITVAGSSGTPTGTVTMSSGSYSSGAVALDTTGKVTITINPGKLAVGTNTLTVLYSGDSKFNSASGTATLTVTKSATTSGQYTFTVTGTGDDAAHTTATTTFTLTVN